MKNFLPRVIRILFGLIVAFSFISPSFAETPPIDLEQSDNVQVVSGTVVSVDVDKITILKATDKMVRGARGEDIRTQVEEDIFSDISLDKEISYLITDETKFANFETIKAIHRNDEVEISFKEGESKPTAVEISRKSNL